MRRLLIAVAAVLLLAVPSALLFLVTRDASDESTSPPVGPPAKPVAPVDPLDAPWKAGDRALALSALGWQPAIVDEVGTTDAAIHYELDGLAPERVDLRLLQRPEPTAVDAAAAAATRDAPGKGKGSRLPPASGG